MINLDGLIAAGDETIMDIAYHFFFPIWILSIRKRDLVQDFIYNISVIIVRQGKRRE